MTRECRFCASTTVSYPSRLPYDPIAHQMLPHGSQENIFRTTSSSWETSRACWLTSRLRWGDPRGMFRPCINYIMYCRPLSIDCNVIARAAYAAVALAAVASLSECLQPEGGARECARTCICTKEDARVHVSLSYETQMDVAPFPHADCF